MKPYTERAADWNRVGERAHEMLAERSIRPFRRYYPWEDEPHLCWRVSGDVWTILAIYCQNEYGWPMDMNRAGAGDRLYGFPIEADGGLPANSMILDDLDAADRMGRAGDG